MLLFTSGKDNFHSPQLKLTKLSCENGELATAKDEVDEFSLGVKLTILFAQLSCVSCIFRM